MDKNVYRGSTLTRWNELVKAQDVCGMRDLSHMKRPFGDAEPVLKVTSFLDLFMNVSFLSVMNKRWTLLYRGQQSQNPLQPGLFRNQWTHSSDDSSWSVSLEGDERQHYWGSLGTVERLALEVTRKHGLPRWRHFKAQSLARWAMVQHYELWPTPLLDFTTSLRVAASFALGISSPVRTGYVYVVCVPTVRSDVMDLEGADSDERASQVLALRLNSVCPPSALRTHLQEGVLLGRYPVLKDGFQEAGEQDLSNLTIATFQLVDDNHTFWSDDFPRHTERSLLPARDSDPLLRDLREAVQYRIDSAGRAHLMTPT